MYFLNMSIVAATVLWGAVHINAKSENCTSILNCYNDLLKKLDLLEIQSIYHQRYTYRYTQTCFGYYDFVRCFRENKENCSDPYLYRSLSYQMKLNEHLCSDKGRLLFDKIANIWSCMTKLTRIDYPQGYVDKTITKYKDSLEDALASFTSPYCVDICEYVQILNTHLEKTWERLCNPDYASFFKEIMDITAKDKGCIPQVKKALEPEEITKSKACAVMYNCDRDTPDLLSHISYKNMMDIIFNEESYSTICETYKKFNKCYHDNKDQCQDIKFVKKRSLEVELSEMLCSDELKQRIEEFFYSFLFDYRICEGGAELRQVRELSSKCESIHRKKMVDFLSSPVHNSARCINVCPIIQAEYECIQHHWETKCDTIFSTVITRIMRILAKHKGCYPVLQEKFHPERYIYSPCMINKSYLQRAKMEMELCQDVFQRKVVLSDNQSFCRLRDDMDHCVLSALIHHCGEDFAFINHHLWRKAFQSFDICTEKK